MAANLSVSGLDLSCHLDHSDDDVMDVCEGRHVGREQGRDVGRSSTAE